MTLRTFLLAADAVRLEEGIGFHVETPRGTVRAPVASPEQVKDRNTQAAAALQAAMAGVQKKGARGRRR